MLQHRSSLVFSLTLVATLGGLLFGYDTAVISGAVKSIDLYFMDPSWPETMRNVLSGLAVSGALIGCILGAVVAGWLSTAYGRKGALMVSGALFLLSGIGSAVPEIGLGAIGGMGPHALIPFILYRILCGTGVGIASMVSPMYIAEIAPSDVRGKLVSFNQMAIVLGMVLVYFVNWGIASQGDEAWVHATGWRLMLGSEVLPALIFIVLLFFVPDTPRWLVMKGREDEAHSLLQELEGPEKAKITLEEIRETLVEKTRPVLSFGWKVIIVGMMLSAFQQLVGINAVLYYAPQMFENMGASSNAALFQTIYVGIANVVFTLVAIFTVDKVGRKPLMIVGALIMAVSMISLGCLFNSQKMDVSSLVAVLVYIAGFALSWGPVTWVLLSEIFPNSIKGSAMAIAVAVQWIMNFVVSWTFKIIDGSTPLNNLYHHGAAYWFYGAMSLLAAFLMWRMVPETKQKKLEAIEAMWVAHAKASSDAAAAKAVA